MNTSQLLLVFCYTKTCAQARLLILDFIDFLVHDTLSFLEHIMVGTRPIMQTRKLTGKTEV